MNDPQPIRNCYIFSVFMCMFYILSMDFLYLQLKFLLSQRFYFPPVNGNNLHFLDGNCAISFSVFSSGSSSLSWNGKK